MPNVNRQTIYQMGNVVNDVVKQATGRDSVQQIDMSYATVAQTVFTQLFSQSGKMVTFDGQPIQTIQNLQVNIPLMQDGSGDPSAENIRKILTINKIKIHHTGNNIFGGVLLRDSIKQSMASAVIDETAKTIRFSPSANAVSECTTGAGLTNKFKENTAYTLILTAQKASGGNSINLAIKYTDNSETVITLAQPYTDKQVVVLTTNPTKTLSGIIKVQQSSGNSLIYYDESGLFEGVLTAADFKPYHGETIEINTDEFVSGYLDNLTGKIAVNSAIDIPTFEDGWTLTADTTNWTAEYANKKEGTATALCSHFMTTTYEDNTNVTILSTGHDTLAELESYQSEQTLAETPIQIAYLLEELQELSFTPIAITTYDGYNATWSDVGNIYVTYSRAV